MKQIKLTTINIQESMGFNKKQLDLILNRVSQLRESNSQLTTQVSQLRESNSQLTTQVSQLSDSNSQLTESNSRLTTQV
ncbi:unnamed protein product, partial [Brachionus calyciflorus]